MLRPVEMKDNKNVYLLKTQTESHLLKLVNHRQEPINRALIKEIFGYKQQKQHLDSTLKNEENSYIDNEGLGIADKIGKRFK